MTQTTLKPIVLSILLISTPILSQAHETEQSVDLDEVTVVGKSRPRATSGLLHTSTASDKIISGDTLRQKPSTWAMLWTAYRAFMPRNTAVARPPPSFAVKQADGLKC